MLKTPHLYGSFASSEGMDEYKVKEKSADKICLIVSSRSLNI